MENQKNFVQVQLENKSLLPIEEEMLRDVTSVIEEKLNFKIDKIYKERSYPIYDLFLFLADNKLYALKINLSPDLPNFWQELSSNNFDFHPKIIGVSDESDDFKFLCYEFPVGVRLSDVSNSPLNPKLKINNIFAKALKSLHQTKISETDKTLEIFESFLPVEGYSVYKHFPVVDLFTILKSSFRNRYRSSLEDCGLCHFDLSPENIFLEKDDFKFINFEYSANANFYLDLWLAKDILNVSDDSFYKFFQFYNIDLEKLNSYQEISRLFNFAYFNSKILSEYITFGVRDPISLKFWIDKSRQNYEKIAYKLYIQKSLDKSIQDFYNLWK